jgi:pilus assembly protein Flp/PilA
MLIARSDRGLRTFLHDLARDDRGAAAIEYALLAMLIALAIVSGVSTIAPKLNTTFATISGKL